jgi:CheY-like chemotaxis protein
MNNKKKILWIEDGARIDLPRMAVPVYMDGSYDLVVAEDVSTAIYQLQRIKFNAVILDIRLPPGDNRNWIKLFNKAGGDKIAARLGLKLLSTILSSPKAEIQLEKHISWITPERIGILTVEGLSELEEDLDELNINVFYQKQANMPETILLNLIEQVLEQNI